MAAFVQGNIHQNGASSLTTCAVTLAAPVGNGNALCVSFSSGFTGASDNITVTDDKANVYSALDTGFNSVAGYSQYTFFTLNVTNAPQTITATDNTTARQFSTIMVDEFSGIIAVAALDGHSMLAQENPGTGADAVSSGTYTTTTNGDLIWGAAVSIATQGMTIGSGFTVGGSNNVGGSFTTEYRIQGLAGAGTVATFTDGNATDETIAASVALKSAAVVQTLTFGVLGLASCDW